MSPKPSSGLYGSNTGANMVRSAVAELVGTFILVFTGTAVAASATIGKATAGGAYDSLAVALAFGFALTAVVACIGHVSGAHVNPAVTIGLFVTGKFPGSHVPVYIAAQLGGAVLGALATWGTVGDLARERANLGATALTSNVSFARGFLTEALITFLLVFVVVAVATDKRVHKAIPPLAVGFALTLGVLIGGPITGGGVNPARALGPMIMAMKFDDFWLYIVAPIAGGIVAAYLYDTFLSNAKDPSAEGSDDGKSEQPRRRPRPDSRRRPLAPAEK